MLPSPIFTSTSSSWPLQEDEERQILNALSLQQHSIQNLSSSWSTDEEELSPLNQSSNITFSTEKNPFQLNFQTRRQSLSNSLRCPICQRRFHSQGNLSNHTQLYHY